MEMQESTSIAPLRSLTLDLPPSCIEFCPAHPEYFVVGTYNLRKEEVVSPVKEEEKEEEEEEEEEQQQKYTTATATTTTSKPQNRNGSLVLFRLTDKSDVSHVQTVPYPSAILDLHFHPSQDKNHVMAIVSSTGSLSLFRLSLLENPSDPLQEIVTHKPLGGDESVLFLSCAWHPRLHNLIAVTTSSYEVHVLRVDDSWGVHETSSTPVITHTLEAWTVAFSPFIAAPTQDGDGNGEEAIAEETSQTFTIFSGGDDSKLLTTSCLFHAHPEQDNGDAIDAPYPIVAFRGHEAGVTAILPLPLRLTSNVQVVVTGSYDDRLRVYSVQTQEGGVVLQSPKLVAEENLGGGVWRLKLVRLDEASKVGTSDQTRWAALILASCMHAGSRVLEVSGDYNERCHVKVLARFEEHKSMNYGSDFEPGSEQVGKVLRCVSTSFYDRLLCLWEGMPNSVM
ncbi:hypothetical protein F4775DRAFT_561686 [Biscogniauxia sp. FL1348]|nr:hypothetical protein F4775DRAFT_561686 [Biscogniauxia sp. FL1348]